MTQKVSCLSSLIGGLLLLGTSVNGAGFALQEQSVSGLGNAFAGGAAAMEDNSVIYTNPAALVGIDGPQLQVGLHSINPDTEYKDLGTTTYGIPTAGGESSSDNGAVVPNIYYSQPINEDWVAGIGVSVPFGLATEWGDDWVGRYIADYSDLHDINIQPTLAYKVNDKLSIGAGVDISMVSAELTNAVNMGLVFLSAVQGGSIPAQLVDPALLGDVQASLGTTKYDGSFKVEGDGVGYGFNVGALYKFNEQTRVGIHYRTKIKVDLEGDVTWGVGALAPYLGSVFPNGGGMVDLELPSLLNLSVFHQINDKWSIMGDIQRTGWSSFEYLIIEFEEASPSDSVVPELWDDCWRYAVGANYQVSDALKLRAGLSIEETPIPSPEYRSPRIPDADRVWYTLGLEYVFSDALSMNAGLAYIIADDPEINNDTHSTAQHLKGVMDATVSIFSVSLIYNF